MKKFYFLLFFGLLFNIGFSQESICEKFKIGKFLYTSEGLPDITVTRTKTTQTETIKESPEVIQGTIVWKSNCTYEFIFTKGPVPELIGRTMSVEIFNINGNTAKGKALFEGKYVNFGLEKLD
ncbi:hypothetical protein [Flavobacterium saccharophilum]|uniref:Uncharacterized protein n=1 Tax=Flavobacterium saccharophilum TaxID=29534 RepID=A0A1M7M0S2_9FLAO|nr:hypothetical protein [Flavobacterium saccharophilum]SHM84122.1 hypothetical protein SAMN05444366_4284 [Flavobacterium saccharophilum]